MSDTWKWLKSTEELQKDYYGNDLRAMGGGERDRHIVNNVLAATDELHEALAETSWKPWASETGIVNKSAFKGELVDVLHFVANLCLLGDITEDELWKAYQEKQQRNRERMSRKDGYKAMSNRCESCKRELDKPDAYNIISQDYIQDGEKHLMSYVLKCNSCDSRFTREIVIGEETLPGQVA